jgi:hypothetical protein
MVWDKLGYGKGNGHVLVHEFVWSKKGADEGIDIGLGVLGGVEAGFV